MEVVRNFINILGLTPASELPDRINGQVIQHGDVETIYITEDNFSAKSIFQIIIQAKITSHRRIDTPIGTTIIIDGFKEFKILYSEDGDSSKARIAVIKVPYNTFAELPSRETDVEKINIYLLDAYFELLDSRRLYSFITYLVDIQYRNNGKDGGLEQVKYDQEKKDSLGEMEYIGITYERTYKNGEEIMPISEGFAEIKNNGLKLEKENSDSQILIDIDSEYL